MNHGAHRRRVAALGATICSSGSSTNASLKVAAASWAPGWYPGVERGRWDLYPSDPDFVVLADPDGNRFCVIDTSR